MCLITLNKTPQFLEEDLIVYKGLQVSSNGRIISPVRKKDYLLNYLYETDFIFNQEYRIADGTVLEKLYELELRDYIRHKNGYGNMAPSKVELFDKTIISISAGFHAATTLKRLQSHIQDYHHRYYSYFECIFPKGSTVYTDETGLTVSNKIIIVKQL